MSSIITKGFLIKKQDYEVFDEIITFINQYGNKFICLSKGSKKILSKNGRNLFLGNYIEFEFFASRSTNKIGRLVRCKIVSFPKNYRSNAFDLLNYVADYLDYPSIKNFKFYSEIIDLIDKKQFSDLIIQLIILRKLCFLLGIDINVNKCVNCKNNRIKTVSFSQHGLLCYECWEKDKSENYTYEFTSLLITLFSNDFTSINVDNKYLLPLIKMLKVYIFKNTGINLIRI